MKKKSQIYFVQTNRENGKGKLWYLLVFWVSRAPDGGRKDGKDAARAGLWKEVSITIQRKKFLMTRTDPACSTNTLLIIQSIQYFIVVLHNVDEVGTPLMSSADTFNVFIIRQSRTQRTVRTIQRFYSLILLQREIKLNTFSWREREREERRGERLVVRLFQWDQTTTANHGPSSPPYSPET